MGDALAHAAGATVEDPRLVCHRYQYHDELTDHLLYYQFDGKQLPNVIMLADVLGVQMCEAVADKRTVQKTNCPLLCSQRNTRCPVAHRTTTQDAVASPCPRSGQWDPLMVGTMLTSGSFVLLGIAFSRRYLHSVVRPACLNPNTQARLVLRTSAGGAIRTESSLIAFAAALKTTVTLDAPKPVITSAAALKPTDAPKLRSVVMAGGTERVKVMVAATDKVDAQQEWLCKEYDADALVEDSSLKRLRVALRVRGFGGVRISAPVGPEADVSAASVEGGLEGGGNGEALVRPDAPSNLLDELVAKESEADVEKLKDLRASAHVTIATGDTHPVAFGQELWLELHANGWGSWPNISLCISVSRDVTSPDFLCSAAQALVRSNSSLRTRFEQACDGSWCGRIVPAAEHVLPLRVLRAPASEAEAIKQLAAFEDELLDPCMQPPVQALVLACEEQPGRRDSSSAEGRHWLCLVAHHVICDYQRYVVSFCARHNMHLLPPHSQPTFAPVQQQHEDAAEAAREDARLA